MIVLRLTIDKTPREVRSERPYLVLGADPASDVHEADAGWQPREAVLVHQGADVLVKRVGDRRDLTLRVGDEIKLGRARITLAGLLPLMASASGPTFGGYEDDLPGQPMSRQPGRESRATPPPPPIVLEEPPPPTASPPSTGGTGDAPPPEEGATGRARPRRTRTDASRAGASKAAALGVALEAPKPTAPDGFVSSFERQDFGHELLHQLKRTPFFAASVAVHLLLFFLFALLQSNPPAGTDGQGGHLQSALLDPAEQDRVTMDREPDEIPTLPEIPEIEVPELLPPETDDTQPPQDDASLEDLPAPDDANTLVGLQPSLTTARLRTAPKAPPAPRVDMGESFEKADALGANRRAAEYIRSELGLGTGAGGNPLDTLVREDLLVVDGAFDDIGRTLTALRMPFVKVPPMSFALTNAPDLNRHKAIFWNCGESLPPRQAKIVADRLKDFVEDGGYLFTTDWAVEMLADMFPGMVKTNGKRSPMTESVVEIRPTPGQENHPLLEGVFHHNTAGSWWLEQASFDVLDTSRRRVTVLIESPELQSEHGRSPIVAVTFRHGKGRVLHVVGHYYQKMGNLAGTISAQRLALNFVIMRLKGR